MPPSHYEAKERQATSRVQRTPDSRAAPLKGSEASATNIFLFHHVPFGLQTIFFSVLFNDITASKSNRATLPRRLAGGVFCLARCERTQH